MQHPPLNWLRSFNEAAREQSFTRAAHNLSLTQAAVSKHVKGLEAYLAVRLFIREAHGLQLTEQGKRYHASSAPLLQQLERVTQDFAARADADRLRIRSNISYSTMLLPAHLAALQLDIPDAQVDINNGIWQPNHPSENAHIEIGYAPRASLKLESQQAPQQLKLLADDQLMPVVAPHVNEQQLVALPQIQVAGYTGEWRWWLEQQPSATDDSAFQQWRIKQQSRSSAAIRCDNSLTAYQLCARGLGVVLARSSLVQQLLDSGQLRCMPSVEPLPAPEVFFARLNDRGLGHRVAEKFFSLL